MRRGKADKIGARNRKWRDREVWEKKKKIEDER
jgi:hypothetical protein